MPNNNPFRIDKNINIRIFPANCSPVDGKVENTITLGDMHGNTMKLLWSLIYRGVIIGIDKQTFDELWKIYDDSSGLTKGNLDAFVIKLKGLKYNSTLKVRLIGDVLADRGKNDALTLELLDRLLAQGVAVELIASNHDSVAIIERNRRLGAVMKNEKDVAAYCSHNKWNTNERGEDGSGWTSFVGGGPKTSDKFVVQDRSRRNLAQAIKSGAIAEERVQALMNNLVFSSLRLISYNLKNDGQNIELFMHAPSEFHKIKALAKELGLEAQYKDATALELAETIDKMNAAFLAKIQNFTGSTSNFFGRNSELCKFLTNKDEQIAEGDFSKIKQSYKDKAYVSAVVFGHISKWQNPDPKEGIFYNTDEDSGKAGENPFGKYIEIDKGTALAFCSHEPIALQLINQVFMRPNDQWFKNSINYLLTCAGKALQEHLDINNPHPWLIDKAFGDRVKKIFEVAKKVLSSPDGTTSLIKEQPKTKELFDKVQAILTRCYKTLLIRKNLEAVEVSKDLLTKCGITPKTRDEVDKAWQVAIKDPTPQNIQTFLNTLNLSESSAIYHEFLNKQNSDKKTLLRLAAEKSDAEAVKLLLQAGSSPKPLLDLLAEKIDQTNTTIGDVTEIGKMNGFITQGGVDERTLLHYAVMFGMPEVVEALLASGKFDREWMQKQDKNGKTALDMAIDESIPIYHKDRVPMLTAMRVKLGEQAVGPLQQPAAYAAFVAKVENTNDINRIFREYAITEVKDQQYKTKIMLELIKDPKFNAYAADQYGRTPLHYAVMAGSLEVVEALLKQKNPNDDAERKRIAALIKARDVNNETALQMAYGSRNKRLSDGNTRGKIASTLVYALSLSSGTHDVGSYLVDLIRTPSAGSEMQIDVLTREIKNIVEESPVNQAYRSTLTSLDCALVFQTEKDWLESFEENNTNVEDKQKIFQNIFYLQGVTEVLVKSSKFSPTELKFERGRTILHKVAEYGYEGAVLGIIRLLKDRYATKEIDAKTRSGKTPLYLALEHGHVGVAYLLLKNGADPKVIAHMIRVAKLDDTKIAELWELIKNDDDIIDRLRSIKFNSKSNLLGRIQARANVAQPVPQALPVQVSANTNVSAAEASTQGRTELSPSLVAPFDSSTDKVDLTNLPKTSPNNNGQYNTITLGDMHGNAMKLLWSLVYNGVITDMTDTTLDGLWEIYERSTSLTKNDLNSFINSISRLKYTKGMKVRLLGDVLADRGNNDALTLELLHMLHARGIAVELIASNHDAVSIEERNKPLGENLDINGKSLDGWNTYQDGTSGWTSIAGGDYPGLGYLIQDTSRRNLAQAIKNEAITEDRARALANELFASSLKLLSYTLTDNGEKIVIYTHAPNGFGMIVLLAERLGTTYKAGSASELATTIDDINGAFRGQISSFNEPARLSMGDELIKNFLNMRPDSREEYQQYHKLYPEWVTLVHGHDGPCETPWYKIDNISALNSDTYLAKVNTPECDQGTLITFRTKENVAEQLEFQRQCENKYLVEGDLLIAAENKRPNTQPNTRPNIIRSNTIKALLDNVKRHSDRKAAEILVSDKFADVNALGRDGRGIFFELLKYANAKDGSREYVIDIAKYIISKAALNPAKADRYGMTPLHYAVWAGLPEVVEALLEQKNPNDAAERKRIVAAIKARNVNNETALQMAYNCLPDDDKNARAKIASILFNKLKTLSPEGDVKNYLLGLMNTTTANKMQIDILKTDLGKLGAIAGEAANVINFLSLLEYSRDFCGNKDTLTTFEENNASVEKKQKLFRANFHSQGVTELLIRSSKFSPTELKFERGRTILHKVAAYGYEEAVSRIITKLVNTGNAREIDAKTWSGKTPLYLALENGHIGVAYLLLKNGADPKVITQMLKKQSLDRGKVGELFNLIKDDESVPARLHGVLGNMWTYAHHSAASTKSSSASVNLTRVHVGTMFAQRPSGELRIAEQAQPESGANCTQKS